MSVIFQIIAFDELRTDFKNPIDQSNPTRAVRTLLFLFFQECSNPRVKPFSSLPKGTFSDLHINTENKLRVSLLNVAYEPKVISQYNKFQFTPHKQTEFMKNSLS